MKLRVVCVQYHTVVLVGDDGGDEEAKATVDTAIREGTLQPADAFVLEPKHERDLPADWREQEPFVGATISDTEYAAHAQTADGENLNSVEIYDHLYTK